jgi:hypothetical protein
VKITLTQRLGTDEELELLNVITVKVHSMHQLPRLWHLAEGETDESHLYNYELSYLLPGLTAETLVTGATILPADPAEQPEAADGDAPAEADPPPRPASDEPGEDEFAFLQSTGARVRVADERRGPRLRFAHALSAALPAPAARALSAMLARGTRFPVAVARSLRDGGDYVYRRKYHGLAEPDLSGLLAPGATRIVVRCPIGPHSDYGRPGPEELEACPPPGGAPEEDDPANPYLFAQTYLLLEVSRSCSLSDRLPLSCSLSFPFSLACPPYPRDSLTISASLALRYSLSAALSSLSPAQVWTLRPLAPEPLSFSSSLSLSLSLSLSSLSPLSLSLARSLAIYNYIYIQFPLPTQVSTLRPLVPEPPPAPPPLPRVADLIPQRPPVPVHAPDPAAEAAFIREARDILVSRPSRVRVASESCPGRI